MSITHSRAVTTVILFQGQDLDPLAEHRAAYQRAILERLAGTTSAPLRHGDDGPEDEGAEPATDREAREHDEFLDAAIGRATHLRLAAMPRKEYGYLLDEHPPREPKRAPDTLSENEAVVAGEVIEEYTQDHTYGFNIDAMSEPLVLGCLKAWDELPEDRRPEGWTQQFEDDQAREAFADDLSKADFSKVFSACVPLNQGGGPDPKARLSSLLDRM